MDAQNVAALFPKKEGGGHAHEPDDPESVIDVFVRDEDILDVDKGDSGFLQLYENAVAAPAVHQQTALRPLKHETGVVVAQRVGRSRAENDEPLHGEPPCLLMHDTKRRAQRQEAKDAGERAFVEKVGRNVRMTRQKARAQRRNSSR